MGPAHLGVRLGGIGAVVGGRAASHGSGCGFPSLGSGRGAASPPDPQPGSLPSVRAAASRPALRSSPARSHRFAAPGGRESRKGGSCWACGLSRPSPKGPQKPLRPRGPATSFPRLGSKESDSQTLQAFRSPGALIPAPSPLHSQTSGPASQASPLQEIAPLPPAPGSGDRLHSLVRHAETPAGSWRGREGIRGPWRVSEGASGVTLKAPGTSVSWAAQASLRTH